MVDYPADMAVPLPRADMSFVMVKDNVIFMHGKGILIVSV
jgi:hypothetical protein